MTVSATPYKESYAGNGVTTVFPVPFYFLADTDLVVSDVNDTTGVITPLSLTTDYTVSGARTPTGGAVNLVVATATGHHLTIERSLVEDQPTHFVDGDPLPAAGLEQALDRIVMLYQQAKTALDRAAKFVVGSTSTTDLPEPQEGTVLGWVGGKLKNLSAATAQLAADLLSSAIGKGAALITYLAPYTGAVATTQQQVNSESVSIFRFMTAAQIADVVANTALVDVTAPVQAAATYAYNNRKRLIAPQGTYKLTAKVSTPGPITLIGESQSPSATPDLLQGYPGVTFLSTVVGDYALQFGGTTYSRGGHYENFRVYGAGVAGSGLYLQNQGWDGCIKNVVVEGFKLQGVTFDYLQDCHIDELCIINCGTENANPSLNLINGCNSIHFTRLHIEVTPYMMHISGGQNLTFDGCHFEVSEYPSAPNNVLNRYSRYQQILVDGGSSHIYFNGCLFAPGSVQATATHFSVAETSIASFLSVTGTNIKFQNCAWRQTQTGKSSNMINFNTSSSCVVDGCTFEQVYTDVYSISLSGVTFVNNDITWLDTGGTSFYGITNVAGGSPSFVDRNRLFCSNAAGTAKTVGYLLYSNANGSCLTVGDNPIAINKFFKHHNALCVAGPSVLGRNRVFVDGLSTIDLEYYDMNMIFGAAAAGATITSITNPGVGQLTRFISYTASTFQINNGGTTVLKGAVNASIPNNGILTLSENLSGYFVELCRNF